MAETTADVRRDIELTRERMSHTIAQLEQKLNIAQTARDHPWASLAVAAGAGFLLASSRADTKAARATSSAAGGAVGRLGTVLDDAASRLVGGVSAALGERVEGWVNELRGAISAPPPLARRAPELDGSPTIAMRGPRAR
jgi:hypothetical protein